MELLFLFLAGACGSLAKDIVIDGKLQLPKIVDDALILGFIGGMVVGGFVGMIVDGSMVTAAMGGYVGISVIENLIGKNGQGNSIQPSS